ncbi:MAG: Rrf2 family transcriptional regulator [Armatimonadota bacterium]|nr:Rrf2 family transcriptional regulator [bacterium]MCS7309262.1 Rrf2 family transcriptional regulator [Armatimonadota bacterium]MDW8104064.1 Rrf2 family transcriptional regulator [Armatimonadota bacterium]MDW8290044.1 Rrf2 family transcriptional regulator [Armatimonadota bacterium]
MPLFSAKMEYALRSMLYLAQQPAGVPVQSRDIAEAEYIPGPYLDQILATLKRAGLVRSMRGVGGGYELAKPPSQITVGDVVRAFSGDTLQPSEATQRDSAMTTTMSCIRDFQRRTSEAIWRLLDATTLQHLLEQKYLLDQAQSIAPYL